MGELKFDMQKARQICLELGSRDKVPLPDRIRREERALDVLPAALDRIDELEKQTMHDCISCRSEAYQEGKQSQSKRISELEKALVEERTWFLAAEDGHHLEDLSELVSFPGEKSRFVGRHRNNSFILGKPFMLIKIQFLYKISCRNLLRNIPTESEDRL